MKIWMQKATLVETQQPAAASANQTPPSKGFAVLLQGVFYTQW
jgi:hypothetical protein